MAKLARKFLNLFGMNGTVDNFGQFGSQAAGAPVNTKDVLTIQGLATWVSGWQSAVNPTNKAPFLEDMNSLFYVLAYQAVYGFQEGLPEYDSTTTYYIGSVVKSPSSFDLYGSLVDNNIGNPLPSLVSNANWRYLGNLSNLLSNSSIPVGGMVDFGGTVAPTGYLLCDGTAVSRLTYASLFSTIGVTWGTGDGVTTFNLPDFRRRVGVGSGGSGSSILGNAVGNVGGEESHVLSIAELPNFSLSVETIQEGSVGGSGYEITGSGGGAFSASISTNSIGSNQGHNNIQPSAVVLKIIKF